MPKVQLVLNAYGQMPEEFHIMPDDGLHEATPNCWCKPILEQECSESIGPFECASDCWRCDGNSWVAPWNKEFLLLILHNA